MPHSLLFAFAVGPTNFDGQALMKFQRAISSPFWLNILIDPFLRASSICPFSMSWRHFHMSMASVIPRFIVMLFHFNLPGTLWMTGSPFAPLALYSTTSFSLPNPVHSRKAPWTCPWNSSPNHVETNGSSLAIYFSFLSEKQHWVKNC